MFISSLIERSEEKKGSFFKLIDSFVWEIGTLKKEMVQKAEQAEGDPEPVILQGLDGQVGGLFLPPCVGVRAGLAGVRDSGYDSLHRRMSVLDRLVQTHAVWLQLGLSRAEATRKLQSQPTGTFLVRKSTTLQRKVISLRMHQDSETPIKDFPVKECQYTFSLERSGLSFADLFHLVAFCCISRDVLPFTLKLPEAISAARTPTDLEVAKQGAGFWGSERCRRRSSLSSLSRTTTHDKSPSLRQRSVYTPLVTRTPSQLECSQSNGALCFINPLFLKVHHPEGGNHTFPSYTSHNNNNPQHLNNSSTTTATTVQVQQHCTSNPEQLKDSPQPHSDSPQSDSPGNSTQHHNSCGSVSRANRVSLPPPPRPPPPCCAPRRPASPQRQRSMPEKISWINPPKEKERVGERKKGSSLLSRLGSTLSISPSSSFLSSSPPKKRSTSAPISIPLSLSSPSDVDCRLVLDDQTIENAISLSLAKRALRNATTPDENTEGNSPSTQDQALSCREEGGGRGGREEDCIQRLSDMSISTDSTDSVDFSQGFFPPIAEPSPPTTNNLVLPLTHPYSSMEEDDDEDEADFGVSVENDQDQDLTITPPGLRTKRRASVGAMVIQQALRGHFRKMSGVFSSLLTPEKRAIRRVLELSRDKGSYFGCLVQDYLSFLQEGGGCQAWQCHASGVELLQTLRQFITQMKSYLRQSSELEPPIESLIPEDQIDYVLEKAMHKIVLKPLKGVVGVALQEFQVRSGAWQELKENLSLAKARQPHEMGVANAFPPDPVNIEKIRHKFHTMCKLYSPEKKITMLLRVCKLIYTIMEHKSGCLYGADDFLPMLTYVLAQCDMPQLDNEILYMMEVLDPSLLHGEGGYYLTSAYGAMSLIRNFQEEQAARVLSSETRNTLRQWHCRRTTQHSAPSVNDFQNYLRVALQDSGCTAKTLQVQPYATTEEICQICAYKFKVPDPENYALILLTEGSCQQLAPDTHPQKIKAELHSQPQAAPFHFVFCRVANLNDLAATSFEPQSNLNNITLTKESEPNLNGVALTPSDPQPNLNLGLSLSLSLPPNQHNGNSISI
ncbi:ras and Rab interactor 2 isoform X1 [Oncorhynchus kisutch]|uniref:Ras and Rab interactor 2 n=1 Tax=Oncorhynchus kisutch TaxID=8019 RepID=A0A8C7N1X2_ONCKI|nr:ras and Rab interactor 2 isoform X1 [Oncorhynchus kisutch]